MYSDFSTLVALREKNFKIYFTLVFIESTSTFVIRFISTCLSNEKLKDMAQKERVKPVKYINTVKYINYFDV